MLERVVNFRVSHLPNEPPVCYLGEENAKPRWMRNEPPRPYHRFDTASCRMPHLPRMKVAYLTNAKVFSIQHDHPFNTIIHSTRSSIQHDHSFRTIIHNPCTFSKCPTPASSPLKPTILLFSYVSILPRRSKEGRPNCSKAYCLDSGIDTTTTTVRHFSRF